MLESNLLRKPLSSVIFCSICGNEFYNNGTNNICLKCRKTFESFEEVQNKMGFNFVNIKTKEPINNELLYLFLKEFIRTYNTKLIQE